MDFQTIMEEAYRKALYQDPTSGEAVRSARVSLNLIITEWQNKGNQTWNQRSESVPLLVGEPCQIFTPQTVTDPNDPVETQSKRPVEITQVLYAEGIQGSDSVTEYDLRRASAAEYARQTQKRNLGRPTMFWVDKRAENICINLWPAPDNSVASLTVWYLQRVQVDDPQGDNALEVIPAGFEPALTSALAHRLAQKHPVNTRPPGYFQEVIMPLQEEAMMLYQEAFSRSNDRAPFSISGGARGVNYNA